LVGDDTLNAEDFIPKCKELVAQYTNEHTDISDGPSRLINPEDVYVVWYAKTLQNAKALLSTPLPDGMYYEVTLNGDKNEIYFDAYKKFHNMKVEV
jgi:hypothetical protein